MQLVSRGGSSQRRHTLDGVEQVFRHYGAVEVGVRSTVDGVLVLADDDMIDDCIIRKCSLAQLREKLPELATLEDVLKLHQVCDKKKELFLNLQHRDVIEPLAEMLGGAAGAERVLLLAFDHDIIDTLRPKLPTMRMLYLLEEGDRLGVAVRRARRTGVAGLGVDVRLLPQVRSEWTPLFPLWSSWCPLEYDTPQMLRYTRTTYPWLQRYTTDLHAGV